MVGWLPALGTAAAAPVTETAEEVPPLLAVPAGTYRIDSGTSRGQVGVAAAFQCELLLTRDGEFTGFGGFRARMEVPNDGTENARQTWWLHRVSSPAAAALRTAPTGRRLTWPDLAGGRCGVPRRGRRPGPRDRREPRRRGSPVSRGMP